MHKILRYYSHNKLKVIGTILAIIFILCIIQVLNNISKEKIKQENQKGETTNVVSYRNESKSIVSEGNVPETVSEKFGSIIDEFYKNCVNHNPEKAYELLAPDTKKVLYQTEKQFENLYYKEKFKGNKQYSFQSWSKTEDTYIYQVKIFENMLQTGKSINDGYIEDYITIVPVEDSYKININNYIGRKVANKKNSNDLITVEIATIDTYFDHQIYNIRVKNNTNEKVILDTRNKTNTIYITDDKQNKFEAFLYENEEQELILNPQQAKNIKIKFNVAYRNNLKITSLKLTDTIIEGTEDKHTLNIETE